MRNASLFMFVALAAVSSAESPYASQVVESTGLSGSSLYNDPYALLGKPSTTFKNSGFGGAGTGKVKLVEAAYNTDPSGNKLITTIGSGQSVTVAFDHMVEDDILNPYGLDFIVFGNSFFSGNGFVSDSTNMNTYTLTGGVFSEPLQISVSPNLVDWYTYANGPYGDTLFPTNAYQWDADKAVWTEDEMDFTKPVDPGLTSASFAGITGAKALDLYNGSGGGTGFDLSLSGFSAIQYIRISGISGYSGGEIDAFADVAPVPEPGLMIAFGLGGLALVRRRKVAVR